MNRTIGSPFLFTRPNTVGVQNNIVVMHHLGVQGELREGLTYKLLGSYSRNYGAKRVIRNPETLQGESGRFSRKDQFSLLLETSVNIKSNMNVKLDLAFDTGELYANQIGGMISLVYKIR